MIETITKHHPEINLICQAYDGARHLKRQYALFIHCHVHKFNVALPQGTNSFKKLKSLFACPYSFHNFFSYSNKKTVLFTEADNNTREDGGT